MRVPQHLLPDTLCAYVCALRKSGGYYRKKFYVDDVTEHTILHFGGVDNTFFVYLNGEFVGFSKVSRSPAEFDITDN